MNKRRRFLLVAGKGEGWNIIEKKKKIVIYAYSILKELRGLFETINHITGTGDKRQPKNRLLGTKID